MDDAPSAGAAGLVGSADNGRTPAWYVPRMTTPQARALAGSARWQRRADRLARWAWPVLLASVALALVGGLVVAAWNPDTGVPQSSAEACENPPCFGGGGLPGAHDLPVVLPVLGYGLAAGLGLPSLLAGGWDLLRGRRGRAGGCSRSPVRCWSWPGRSSSPT